MASKYTLVALVEDKPGVLNAISSLFRRRGFNIDSIAVGHSEQPDISRVTIVVNGSAAVLEQARKQLLKIVEVVKTFDINPEESVARELALIKVKTNTETRSEIMQIVSVFRANIVDVAHDSLTVEVTGDGDKVDSLYRLLQGFGIKEMARTGLIAMTRGAMEPPPETKE
jgi:acetolactate synthase I/III small subunit